MAVPLIVVIVFTIFAIEIGVDRCDQRRPDRREPAQVRVDRLREFWTQVTSVGGWPCFSDPSFGLARGDIGRNFLNQMSAGLALANGASGFSGHGPSGRGFRRPERSRRRASKIPLISSARWSAWSILTASTPAARD